MELHRETVWRGGKGMEVLQGDINREDYYSVRECAEILGVTPKTIRNRIEDKKLNAINTGLPKNNTSGVKGVSWNKACGKWSAQIKVDGKKKHLGTFSNLEDATKTRRQAERLYGFII